MTLRIHVQSIYPVDHPGFSPEGYDEINRGMQRIYDRVLQPDTRVEPRFVDRSTYYTSHRYLDLLNDAEVVRGIIEGEEDGCDVAMGRCGNDAGVQAAREMVRIPAVAMSEASMHLASRCSAR
jgi:allantoin racemase